MTYRLAVLTHGTSETLPAALGAFFGHASPGPAEAVVVYDGIIPSALRLVLLEALEGRGMTLAESGLAGGAGYCAATGLAWAFGAREPGPEFVFYLEHDFLLTRDVDLAQLAAVLDANPRLAQMALMRDAVNERERAAGGLFESRPGQYLARGGWLEHAAYLTTNPSLMRRAFMADNPWPDYPARCEGLFGLDLVRRGYAFGAWGGGEPWCRHAGDRDGHGY